MNKMMFATSDSNGKTKKGQRAKSITKPTIPFYEEREWLECSSVYAKCKLFNTRPIV